MATLYGSNAPDLIANGSGATFGNDDIFGWDEDNRAGDFGPATDADTLFGAGGDDLIEGGAGNDSLSGEDGIDDLIGGAGNDWLSGGAEGDFMEGGLGNDTLVSDTGTGDWLVGGTGADRFETNGSAFNRVTYTITGVGVFESYGDVITYYDSNAGIRYVGGIFSGGDAQGDVVVGAAYTLVGSEKGDEIESGTFSRVYGLGGNDRMTGAGFVSVFWGGRGNDTLTGFGGAELNGGLGDDNITGTAGGFGTEATYNSTGLGVRVNLTLTTRQNTGAEGRDLLRDIVDLTGGTGNDHFTGTAGANRLSGEAGNDTVLAGGGDDTLRGGAGADSLNGGDGIDSVVFLSGVTLDLNVPAQNLGEAEGDVYVAIEIFEATFGNSVMRGNSAANTFKTGFSADQLYGGDGNDVLDASGGNDSLFGGTGDDHLDGSIGVDTMDGGLGNDVYGVDTLDDVITELAGQGRDTVKTNLAKVNLATDFAGISVENLQSSSYFGNDPVSFTGTAGNNTLSFSSTFASAAGLFKGMSGNDVLIGSLKNDTLMGGIGRDVLDGARGVDSLTGGLGGDRFVFGDEFGLIDDTGVEAALRDVITDFGLGPDLIDLRRIDAGRSSSLIGDNRFEFIGTRAFDGNIGDSALRGEVRYVITNKPGTAQDRTVIYGALNGDTSADFAITLRGVHTLTADDFLL